MHFCCHGALALLHQERHLSLAAVVSGLGEVLLVRIFGALRLVCSSAKGVAKIVEIFADGTIIKFEEVVVNVLAKIEVGSEIAAEIDVAEGTEAAWCLAVN